MPTVGAKIDRLVVAGDWATWTHEVTDVPSGRTITEAVLAFFPQSSSTAVVWKHVTTTPSPDGEVTDAGGGGTGSVDFRLTGTETALIGTDWVDHVVRVKLDDDSEFTVEGGDYRQDTARAIDAPVQPAAP